MEAPPRYHDQTLPTLINNFCAHQTILEGGKGISITLWDAGGTQQGHQRAVVLVWVFKQRPKLLKQTHPSYQAPWWAWCKPHSPLIRKAPSFSSSKSAPSLLLHSHHSLPSTPKQLSLPWRSYLHNTRQAPTCQDRSPSSFSQKVSFKAQISIKPYKEH